MRRANNSGAYFDVLFEKKKIQKPIYVYKY